MNEHPLDLLLLRDRYRVIKLLGQGGFGRTFLAIDEAEPIQPRCAIKQLYRQVGSGSSRQSVQFRQEALRLLSLGKHPRIPRLLDHFEQEGQFYLVQQWIEGATLAEELAETGAFDEEQVWQVLHDLLPVLQFIHDRQIVHRDVKPANIIHRPDGQLVLVDFGAAKCILEAGSEGARLAQTGTLIGSAEYTAPEQVRGKATYASDLYALGVTCIHLLTQTSPFDLFDTVEDAWCWQAYLPYPISRSLTRVLDGLLQPAVKRRYASAAAVLQDLLPRTGGQAAIGSLGASMPTTLQLVRSLPSVTGAIVFDPATQKWYNISAQTVSQPFNS